MASLPPAGKDLYKALSAIPLTKMPDCGLGQKMDAPIVLRKQKTGMGSVTETDMQGRPLYDPESYYIDDAQNQATLLVEPNGKTGMAIWNDDRSLKESLKDPSYGTKVRGLMQNVKKFLENPKAYAPKCVGKAKPVQEATAAELFTTLKGSQFDRFRPKALCPEGQQRSKGVQIINVGGTTNIFLDHDLMAMADGHLPNLVPNYTNIDCQTHLEWQNPIHSGPLFDAFIRNLRTLVQKPNTFSPMSCEPCSKKN